MQGRKWNIRADFLLHILQSNSMRKVGYMDGQLAFLFGRCRGYCIFFFFLSVGYCLHTGKVHVDIKLPGSNIVLFLPEWLKTI